MNVNVMARAWMCLTAVSVHGNLESWVEGRFHRDGPHRAVHRFHRCHPGHWHRCVGFMRVPCLFLVHLPICYVMSICYVIAGAGLSILFALKRSAFPKVRVLGRLPDSAAFR